MILNRNILFSVILLIITGCSLYDSGRGYKSKNERVLLYTGLIYQIKVLTIYFPIWPMKKTIYTFYIEICYNGVILHFISSSGGSKSIYNTHISDSIDINGYYCRSDKPNRGYIFYDNGTCVSFDFLDEFRDNDQ